MQFNLEFKEILSIFLSQVWKLNNFFQLSNLLIFESTEGRFEHKLGTYSIFLTNIFRYLLPAKILLLAKSAALFSTFCMLLYEVAVVQQVVCWVRAPGKTSKQNTKSIPFCRFLAKTLRVNKIGMKSFSKNKICCSESILNSRSHHLCIKLTYI